MDVAAGPTMNDVFRTGGKGRLVDPAAAHGERQYAMFTHLTALAGHFGLIIIPSLVLWLIKRHESPFIDDHGKEAVNFQISLLIYGLILTIPSFGLALVAVYVLGLVGLIQAATAANRGEYYRYPMCLRIIR